MRRIGADPAFAGPLRRAVAARLVGAAPSLMPADVEALAQSPDGRFAIFMLVAPLDRVEEAALLATAAAMQRDILARTDKAERARLRAALGPDAYQVATREAPVLYANLAALTDASRFRAAMAPDIDGAATRRDFVAFGLALLLRAIAHVPLLPDLVARRLPVSRPPANREDRAGDLDKLMKLIDRRMPTWPAIIG